MPVGSHPIDVAPHWIHVADDSVLRDTSKTLPDTQPQRSRYHFKRSDTHYVDAAHLSPRRDTLATHCDMHSMRSRPPAMRGDIHEHKGDIRDTLGDMPKITHRPHLIDAMRVLGLSQRGMADRLGVSSRTLQRWGGRLQYVSEAKMHELAHALHAKDPDLAAEVALLAGTTPESLGLVMSAPPVQAPLTRALPSIPVLVDSVVCAAAEAVSLVPAAIRPALHAAFRRCREAGLSLEEVEQALRGSASR